MSRSKKPNKPPPAASCRNHGGCTYCLSNRIHKHVKQKLKATPADPNHENETT